MQQNYICKSYQILFKKIYFCQIIITLEMVLLSLYEKVLGPLSFSHLQWARWSLSYPLGPLDVKDVIAIKAVAVVGRCILELQLPIRLPNVYISSQSSGLLS